MFTPFRKSRFSNVKIFWIFYISIIIIILYGTIERAEARTDGYYPPRIHQICNDNFYGVSEDWIEQNPKFANRCKPLWNLWIEEEKAKFKNLLQ